MAERRMFAKTIIDSDAFLDMSTSAQALYFHLAMRADDDGFINNPKKIQRVIGAADDDLKILMAKRFIILFESGVIVIKHWRMHNYIRNDRYRETVYAEEKRRLGVKTNGSYTLDCAKMVTSYDKLATSWQPDDNQLATQVRLGQVSIGKGSGSSSTDDCDDISSIKDAAIRVGLPWKEANRKKALLLAETHTTDWLIRAIDRVALRSAQNWGMVDGILNSWSRQGYVDEPGKNRSDTNNETHIDWKIDNA